MKRLLSLTCFCTMIATCVLSGKAWSAVQGQQDGEYYKASVAVKSQSPQARREAAEHGLMDVLVRVSGDEAVRLNDTAIAKSSNAIRYVQQFQYEKLNDEVLQEAGYTSTIRLSYSSRFVRQILAEAQVRFWPINRPSILVWLVEDHAEFGRQFISSDSEHEILTGISAGAQYRGLPLSFPLLDFDDQLALSPEDAWNLNEPAIFSASARYEAGVILIGKFSSTSTGQVLSSWQLLHRQDHRVFDLRSQALSEIGRLAMDPVADYLTQKYALNLSSDQENYVHMNINGVGDFADYRGVSKLLSRLAAINDYRLADVEGSTLRVYVRTEASIDQLESALRLGGQLTLLSANTQSELPVWQQAERGTAVNPILFRWER